VSVHVCLLGAWLAGARRACSLARRRDRVCKRSGRLRGEPAAGPLPRGWMLPALRGDRSWAEAAPKRAEGRALSTRRASGGHENEGRKEPAHRARREAPSSGRRRLKARPGGAPEGGAKRRDRVRPPAALNVVLMRFLPPHQPSESAQVRQADFRQRCGLSGSCAFKQHHGQSVRRPRHEDEAARTAQHADLYGYRCASQG
jgi:hypothetical protein